MLFIGLGNLQMGPDSCRIFKPHALNFMFDILEPFLRNQERQSEFWRGSENEQLGNML